MYIMTCILADFGPLGMSRLWCLVLSELVMILMSACAEGFVLYVAISLPTKKSCNTMDEKIIQLVVCLQHEKG